MLTPDPDIPGALLEDAGDFVPDEARSGVLMVVGTPEWVVDDARPFNLGMRSRVIDVKARMMTLGFASDEALLQDYAPLVDDTTPRTHEKSLRAVVNYVLGKVIPGAALVTALDKDVTAYWPLSNHIHYPSLSQVAGVAAKINATNIALTTTSPWNGDEAVRWEAVEPGDTAIRIIGDESCQAGDVFTGSAYLRSGTPGRIMRLQFTFLNTEDKEIRTLYSPSIVAPTSPDWLRYWGTVTAPPGAVKIQMSARGNAGAAGGTFAVDGALLTEGDELVEWFSGSTAPAGYTVAWDDDSPPGTSSRVPIIDRPIETLTWKAGVSAWDFLEPLLTSSEVRLFCDELRVWRLVKQDYRVPGVVPLFADSLAEAVDTISRETMGADGVVVRYLWQDAKRGALTKVDTAGTPGKVVTIDYARPYPGPGAARYILNTLKAGGRSQDINAPTDYRATPGMETHIPLLEGGELSGRAKAVSFDLATGLMDVMSKDQTELPPGSIDLLTGQIDALTGQIDALT